MERRPLAAFPVLMPFLTLGAISASAQDSSVAKSAEQTIRTYTDAFAAGDVGAIADHCWEPFMWMTAQQVMLLAGRPETEATYGKALEALRTRGYSHSVWTSLKAQALGPVTAIVSGVAVRYAGGTRELERIGATYIVRQASDRWKIAVLVSHPPTDALKL